MWWDVESERERTVKNEIERVRGLVLENMPGASFVYGVGAIHWNGSLAPLLIVDGKLDPRRENTTGVGGRIFRFRFFSEILYDFVGPLWPLSFHRDPSSGLGPLDLIKRAAIQALLGDTPRPAEWSYGFTDQAGPLFESTFRSWDIQKKWLVLFARPPQALKSVGVAPLTKRKIATIGLVGTVNNYAPGYTTAGHVAEQHGTTVSRARRILGLILRIGEPQDIILHEDPRSDQNRQRGPGYDFAVASPALDPIRSFAARGAVVSHPQSVAEYTTCQLKGTISGDRWGVVGGPLRLARSIDEGVERIWENCWHVTGQGGWFCKAGDSGGVVTLIDGRILGTLVGGLQIGGWLTWGRKEIGFVQDLDQTIEFFRGNGRCAIVVSQ
jgi:hypothetical protein